MNFIEEKHLHDRLRAHFQTVDVQRLNAILIKNGIEEAELRMDILEEYFFDAGNFFDSGWFEAKGKKYSPHICFREVTPELDRSDTVICPDKSWGTIFHEFAHGTVGMVVDDPQSEKVQVKVGEVKS